jgi:hypothetical protein
MLELLKVQMLDGSIFEMPNEHWQKAFDIKYGSQKEQAIEAFKNITKKHFDEKTVPTKFGYDEDWEEVGSFTTHAELGNEVMYIYIRAALFAVVMEAMAEKTGKPSPRVLAVSKDKIMEYTGHSAKEVKKIDEIFKEEKTEEK